MNTLTGKLQSIANSDLTNLNNKVKVITEKAKKLLYTDVDKNIDNQTSKLNLGVISDNTLTADDFVSTLEVDKKRSL